MIKFILNHHRLPVKFALLGVAFLAGSLIAKPQELLTQKALSVDASCPSLAAHWRNATLTAIG